VLEIEYGGLTRKVAIRVPVELREEVDALIAEKLGNGAGRNRRGGGLLQTHRDGGAMWTWKHRYLRQ